MNYLIQRGKVRGQVINVPEGLPELLSDVAREVLRCQPTKECLCQFIIDYLHSVIVTREKALAAKNIIDRALRKVDEIIADMCICDITKEKADEMAVVMEECFRRFLEKRRCERGKEKEIIRFNEVDLLDELIQRCKFSEDELKVSRPLIEEAYNRFVQAYMSAAENTDGTEALYQYFRARELRRWEEKLRNEAALKIQAGFRGYLVRRSLLDSVPPKIQHLYSAGPLGEVTSELYHDMDHAARVIQKFFKEKIPPLSKYDDEHFDMEEQSCSRGSKETIVGDAIGETAPDQRPAPVLKESEEVQEEQAIAVEEVIVEEAEPPTELVTEPQSEQAVVEAEPEPAIVEEPAAPVESPAEAPTEAPAETPAEIPAETPAEAPAETPAEAPAETPAEEAAAPADQPAQE